MKVAKKTYQSPSVRNVRKSEVYEKQMRGEEEEEGKGGKGRKREDRDFHRIKFFAASEDRGRQSSWTSLVRSTMTSVDISTGHKSILFRERTRSESGGMRRSRHRACESFPMKDTCVEEPAPTWAHTSSV